MKLGIVIPLKSKKVSRNWDGVTRCLGTTLRSLAQQTSDQWMAVVVGHEKPDLPWNLLPDRIHWTECPYDLPPIKSGGSFLNHRDFDYITDIRRKIAEGMRFLSGKGAISAWFLLDGDDLVHCDFVRTWVGLPAQAGWILKRGYLWYADIQGYRTTARLAHLCGSTAIVSSLVFKIPEKGDDKMHEIPWCRQSHSDMEGLLRPFVKGSLDFPLPALAYSLSHGDNCSDEFRTSAKARLKLWLQKKFFTRRPSIEWRRAFALEEPSAEQNHVE